MFFSRRGDLRIALAAWQPGGLEVFLETSSICCRLLRFILRRTRQKFNNRFNSELTDHWGFGASPDSAGR